MAEEKIIAGLDIGSHTTQVVVGQKAPENMAVEVIATFEVPSEGVRKGAVVDVDAAAENIRHIIEEAERIAGRTIDEYYVSFGGVHIGALSNMGSVIVSRADREISQSEKERVLNVAKTITLPSNREILEAIPLYYVIDQDQVVKDPAGMKGTKLELKTLIIHGAVPYIRNWEKSLAEAGLGALGRVFSNFAAARSVLSKHQKELGAAVLDIGGTISGLTVFKEGDIVHTVVLPIGSSHITNDIAIGLQVDIDTAEKIKQEFGCLAQDKNGSSRKNILDLSPLGDQLGDLKVSRKELASIVRHRMDELFDMVNKELAKADEEKMFPGGVVIVGGGAKMAGIVDFAKDKLRLPVQIGYPRGIEGLTDKVDDPSYTTAVGLVLIGFDEHMRHGYGSRGFSPKAFKKLFKALRKLLP